MISFSLLSITGKDRKSEICTNRVQMYGRVFDDVRRLFFRYGRRQRDGMYMIVVDRRI